MVVKIKIKVSTFFIDDGVNQVILQLLCFLGHFEFFVIFDVTLSHVHHLLPHDVHVILMVQIFSLSTSSMVYEIYLAGGSDIPGTLRIPQ